jgi:hypothetical protein
MANKQVIFVQGGRRNEAVYPWMFFHFDPHRDADPGPVDLVYFDYPDGKLKIWRNWNKKRGKPPQAEPDTEEELVPKVKIRLNTGELDPGPERASVLALYDYVKKQPKESVRSLQVFSHGWFTGPILWNSSERGPNGEGIADDVSKPRDPNDVDFRARDFHGSNPLAAGEGVKFAQVFTSDALIKLWGCLPFPVIRGFIGPRAHIQNYFSAPKGGKGDAAREAHLKSYLQLVGGTFPMQMALILNLPVWASPFGYGSNGGTVVPTAYAPDGSVSKSFTTKYKGTFPPNLKADHWWRVSWFFANQDRGDELYRDVLKARIDAVHFVEHRKSWYEEAEKRLGASAEPNPVPTPTDLQQQLQDRISAPT